MNPRPAIIPGHVGVIPPQPDTRPPISANATIAAERDLPPWEQTACMYSHCKPTCQKVHAPLTDGFGREMCPRTTECVRSPHVQKRIRELLAQTPVSRDQLPEDAEPLGVLDVIDRPPKLLVYYSASRRKAYTEVFPG